jgi:outer membrane protein
MRMFKLLIVVTILFTSIVSVRAQDKPASDSIMKFSLKEAQTYALQNNKSILNSNLDIESAKQKVWETTAIGLPQVSAKSSFQYTPELSSLVSQFGGLGGLSPWMWNVNDKLGFPNKTATAPIYTPTKESDMKWGLTGDITVSQLLFSGSYLVGLQSAKVYKSLSELNRAKNAQDVLESVTNTYFTVLIAKENAEILDSTYKNIEATVNQMGSMNKQGFIDETDVDQLRITLANLKSSLDYIKSQCDLAEKLLKLQLGIDITKKIELTESLSTLLGTQTYDQLISGELAIEGNINYQMLETSVKASKLLLKLSESECLPNLAAYYQYDKNFNTKGFNMNPPHVIGASLNIPIFASGARYAKIKQAKNEVKKAENSRDQAAEGIRIQFLQSKASLINAKDKYESDKQNMALAEKIYKRSLVKYQNGVISSLELTQAQNQFLTSQTTYYQSILTLISEKNKLEKLTTKN